jgi:hypothetical protein
MKPVKQPIQIVKAENKDSESYQCDGCMAQILSSQTMYLVNGSGPFCCHDCADEFANGYGGSPSNEELAYLFGDMSYGTEE